MHTYIYQPQNKKGVSHEINCLFFILRMNPEKLKKLQNEVRIGGKVIYIILLLLLCNLKCIYQDS